MAAADDVRAACFCPDALVVSPQQWQQLQGELAALRKQQEEQAATMAALSEQFTTTVNTLQVGAVTPSKPNGVSVKGTPQTVGSAPLVCCSAGRVSCVCVNSTSSTGAMLVCLEPWLPCCCAHHHLLPRYMNHTCTGSPPGHAAAAVGAAAAAPAPGAAATPCARQPCAQWSPPLQPPDKGGRPQRHRHARRWRQRHRQRPWVTSGWVWWRRAGLRPEPVRGLGSHGRPAAQQPDGAAWAAAGCELLHGLIVQGTGGCCVGSISLRTAGACPCLAVNRHMWSHHLLWITWGAEHVASWPPWGGAGCARVRCLRCTRNACQQPLSVW
jgi:hypothetical protein